MITNGKVRLVLAVVLAACVVGCDGTTGYPEGRTQPAAQVTPRAEWRAAEATGVQNAELAFDNDESSAASASGGYQGATLTIDFGKVCLFNQIVLHHGPKEMGFARRIAVSTSLDGRTFRKRFDGPGTRRVSIFSLVAPALGRYVRLQVVQPGAEPWSIGEVFVR